MDTRPKEMRAAAAVGPEARETRAAMAARAAAAAMAAAPADAVAAVEVQAATAVPVVLAVDLVEADSRSIQQGARWEPRGSHEARQSCHSWPRSTRHSRPRTGSRLARRSTSRQSWAGTWPGLRGSCSSSTPPSRYCRLCRRSRPSRQPDHSCHYSKGTILAGTRRVVAAVTLVAAQMVALRCSTRRTRSRLCSRGPQQFQ